MAVCQFTYSLPENLHLATAFFATYQYTAAGAYHVR